MWTACALSAFQLLSDDYISYVFFIFFLGVAIGAVLVVAIPYVMEMVRCTARLTSTDRIRFDLVPDRIASDVRPIAARHRLSPRSGHPLAGNGSEELEDLASDRHDTVDHHCSTLLVCGLVDPLF